jgi:hypothetical protein
MSVKNRSKASMPGSRSLFKTIERLFKMTQMLGTGRIDKSRRLMHIDLFLQNSMKKSILNIQLAKRPATSNSQ